MGQLLGVLLITVLSITSFAKTGSFFTLTGDRVMINVQSGHPFSSEGDQDAVLLYQAMKVVPENSIMGKGKRIELPNAITIIVADRGQGKYDGSIMVQQSRGVQIDGFRKTVDVRWEGDVAAQLAGQFNLEKGNFDYFSSDARLKIHIDSELFMLSFSE